MKCLCKPKNSVGSLNYLNDCLTTVIDGKEKNILLRYGESLVGKVKLRKVVACLARCCDMEFKG